MFTLHPVIALYEPDRTIIFTNILYRINSDKMMKRALLLISFTFCCTAAYSENLAEASEKISNSIAPQQTKLIFDNQLRDATNWSPEFETNGSLHISQDEMDVEAPKGATIWFKPRLSSPIEITYEIQAVAEGGTLDQVSDLNCFFMARDPLHQDHLPARSGKFEDYNNLLLYYVGLGGNRNTTSRMRRYIGDPVVRPYLPENDLSAADDLLKPNVWQTIRIVANGPEIRYYRDERLMFRLDDSEPYTSGWFGFRTTWNHMRIRNFRVYRITSKP